LKERKMHPLLAGGVGEGVKDLIKSLKGAL
jgi:hypothetical protein